MYFEPRWDLDAWSRFVISASVRNESKKSRTDPLHARKEIHPYYIFGNQRGIVLSNVLFFLIERFFHFNKSSFLPFVVWNIPLQNTQTAFLTAFVDTNAAIARLSAYPSSGIPRKYTSWDMLYIISTLCSFNQHSTRRKLTLCSWTPFYLWHYFWEWRQRRETC